MSKSVICKIFLPGIVGLLFSTQVYSQQAAKQDARNNKLHNTAHSTTTTAVSAEGNDPCKGTGGTGQIINVADKAITIKRRDGTSETINLTNKTTIKNSTGAIQKSDLKKGDRVTVIVMSHHTATAILVCDGAGSKPVK